MKEKYAKNLKDILKCFDIKVPWTEIHDGSDFEEYVVNPFREKYHKFPYSWDSGASKGVIAFPTLGFVIKMPLHIIDEDSYYIDDYEEDDNYTDYCALEADFYGQAKRLGIEEVFAQTEYVKMLDGEYPIYIQEYIEQRELDEENHIHSDDDEKTVSSLNEEQYGDEDADIEWEAELLAQKGLDFYNKFKKFIINNNINDLRWYDNIGYKNGCPICFDYSGFHD